MAAGTLPSGDTFSYCDICRINHKQKNKHVYSKKHKQRLKTLLTKFANKIEEVQLFLGNPVIKEGKYEERSNTFWCHFCKNNFNKHVTDQLKTVLYGGVLEHLSSESHCDATERFWYINGVNCVNNGVKGVNNGVKDVNKSTFMISIVDLELYKKKLTALVDEYDKKADVKTKHLALQIKAQEDLRKVVLHEDVANTEINIADIYKTVKNKHDILQNPTGFHDGVRVWKGGIVKYKHDSNQLLPHKYNSRTRINGTINHRKAIYTTCARGKGLSSIKLTSNNGHQGNVHTGATPPWKCQTEEDQTTDAVMIGPSQLDFDKHIEQVKKSKLNPNRVGANFRHDFNSGDSCDWLPSFGRVWNDGARWKSRKQYYKEISRGSKKVN